MVKMHVNQGLVLFALFWLVNYSYSIDCPNGLYGPNCTMNCSTNCEGICNKTSGACPGCKSGYYGSHCKGMCGKGCKGTSCNQKYAVCTCLPGFARRRCRVCQVGLYGTNCTQSCPRYCDGACNQNNGACTECKLGFYGDKCNSPCSKGCDGNGSCEKSNGECHCKISYTGPKCTYCSNTHYGKDCAQTCPDNCKGVCNRSDGSCPSCKSGYHGTRCTARCGRGCDGNCSQSGACTCRDGFSPPICTDCIDGKYGTNCDKTCPPCKGPCDKMNGTCAQCPVGLHGDRCNRKCEKGFNGTDSGDRNQHSAGNRSTEKLEGGLIGSGVTLLIAILVALAVIWWFRRKLFKAYFPNLQERAPLPAKGSTSARDIETQTDESHDNTTKLIYQNVPNAELRMYKASDPNMQEPAPFSGRTIRTRDADTQTDDCHIIYQNFPTAELFVPVYTPLRFGTSGNETHFSIRT